MNSEVNIENICESLIWYSNNIRSQSQNATLKNIRLSIEGRDGYFELATRILKQSSFIQDELQGWRYSNLVGGEAEAKRKCIELAVQQINNYKRKAFYVFSKLENLDANSIFSSLNWFYPGNQLNPHVTLLMKI